MKRWEIVVAGRNRTLLKTTTFPERCKMEGRERSEAQAVYSLLLLHLRTPSIGLNNTYESPEGGSWSVESRRTSEGAAKWMWVRWMKEGKRWSGIGTGQSKIRRSVFSSVTRAGIDQQIAGRRRRVRTVEETAKRQAMGRQQEEKVKAGLEKPTTTTKGKTKVQGTGKSKD